MKHLIYLAVLLLLIIPVSASWLYFVSCAELKEGRITPKNEFDIGEPVCMVGGGFKGTEHTVLLENKHTKKTRFLTIKGVNGFLSSVQGYYFTDLEVGQFRPPGECKDQYICQNQIGYNYCLPKDTSCKYVKFKGDDGNCVEDSSFIDKDKDRDLWSDECDAFPNDPEEWSDIDLDRIGSNDDTNDFNSNIVQRKHPKPDNPQNETLPDEINPPDNSTDNPIENEVPPEENNTIPDNPSPDDGPIDEEVPPEEDNVQPNPGDGRPDVPQDGEGESPIPAQQETISSGRGKTVSNPNPIFPDKECTPEYECTFWSACENDKQYRTCTIINNCTNEIRPPEMSQDCVLAIENKGNEAPQNNGTGLGAITGLAVRDVNKSNTNIFIASGLVIVIAGLLFVVSRKIVRKS